MCQVIQINAAMTVNHMLTCHRKCKYYCSELPAHMWQVIQMLCQLITCSDLTGLIQILCSPVTGNKIILQVITCSHVTGNTNTMAFNHLLTYDKFNTNTRGVNYRLTCDMFKTNTMAVNHLLTYDRLWQLITCSPVIGYDS